jgi:transcriptional regulator
MYQPEHFKSDDIGRMHALMRGRPFATLVSSGGLGLFATHLPTVLKSEGAFGVVECHLARANPQWKDLAQAGAAGAEALMIFHGVDGYITPNWYATKPETQKVVPTWNYATVHAYGRPIVMEDGDWKRRHVSELTDQQEASEALRTGARAWALSDAPEDYVQVMLRGIVGFRFEIGRIEGKWKMSQNREARDRHGVIDGLKDRGQGEDHAIADLVAGFAEGTGAA